ncbi:CHAP domain-containing protein [Candidatus Saccharibacteria bacterium]|nr:CHAP domain-containing protein [Candidatus Saccharibacteria bacterium]
MRHIRVRSYLLLILAIFFALSGPISSVTLFSQNSSAIDDTTLDIFAENNIMFYDPDEQKMPDCNSTLGSKPSGNQITWIGDSYTEEAKNIIEEKLSGVDLYYQVSKTVSGNNPNNRSGLTILDELVQANNLRPYLVFALGTNSGWTDSDISELKRLAGSETKVILVTSRTENGTDYIQSNLRIKTLTENNDNIYLADWASDSVYKAEYYASDPEKIHPYADGGFKAWFNVIYNAIPGGSAKSVSGENSVEIIWGYLANTGLFTSEQIAGIIGNALVEVGGYWQDGMDIDDNMLNLNPLSTDPNYVYLFQWYRSTNKEKLDAALSSYNKYLNDSYYRESSSSIPISDRKGIIEILLKYALEVGGGADSAEIWIKEVQAQTTVTAATEAFLVSFEGAAGSTKYPGDPIQEYTGLTDSNKRRVQNKNADGFGYQRRNIRVSAANKIYEMYQGYSGSSTNCNPANANPSDALAFLQQYVRDINYVYGQNNPIPQSSDYYNGSNPNTYTKITDSAVSADTTKLNGLVSSTMNRSLAGGSCFGGTYCGQCTALSGWFIMTFTSYDLKKNASVSGNGADVVNNLSVANNLSISTTPTPWSIFSYSDGGAGHVGIVIGVEGDNIITLENNLARDNRLAIRKYNPSTSGYTYSYVDIKNGIDFSHLGTTYGE